MKYRRLKCFLFVIFRSLNDIHASIDAFEEEDSHELVGKGHFGDREAEVGGVFDAVVKSVRRADDEAKLVCL